MPTELDASYSLNDAAPQKFASPSGPKGSVLTDKAAKLMPRKGKGTFPKKRSLTR